MIVDVPCVEYVNGFEVVPIITPPQLSVVDGAVAVTVQAPVKVAKVGIIGETLSTTVIVKLHEEVFPDASVAL